MSRIFQYDGLLSDDGMTAQGALRCAVDGELGLMWCSSDLVRLVGLISQNSSQLVDYAPDHTKKIVTPGRGHAATRFTSHPVVMQWLLNRPPQHEMRRQLDAWVKIRKFPIADAPAGMPEARESAVKALAMGTSADMPTPEQRHRARFHQEALLCDKPVNLLYAAPNVAKPDDLEPYVSWVDACAFLPDRYGLRPNSHVEQIQDRFKEGSRHIDRVRGANGDFVVVISLTLFENICRIYNERTAFPELVAGGGVNKLSQWRANAVKYGNRRKEFRGTLETRVGRRAPPRRNEFDAPRKTPASLQRQDWNPNSYESQRDQQRARANAEKTARNEMGTYTEMLDNIKPE
jgi:hypothetical protein